MDIQDTPEYALHQIRNLLAAYRTHFETLEITGYLEDAISEGMYELSREEDVYDEKGNYIAPVDENAEHRQELRDVLNGKS